MPDNILESVLATILLDMIKAQNQANCYSAQLALDYTGKDKEIPLLEFFDVPNAIIKSFDFELKFGLESVGSPIGGEMSNKLSELIKSSLNEFVQRCMESYRLPAGSEKELKGFIASLWRDNGDAASSKLSFEPEPKLIEDSNDFIIALKNKVKSLTDSELFLEQNERTPGLRAVLNVSDLNSYNGDMLCSINVNAEIAGMKAGFYEENIKTNDNDKKEPDRKIFLVKN